MAVTVTEATEQPHFPGGVAVVVGEGGSGEGGGGVVGVWGLVATRTGCRTES